MQSSAHLLVEGLAIAIGVGILAQVVADRVRLPSIVFLLGFGVLVGPDVLGWIDTAEFGAGLQAIVTVAVALILFEGGLQLHYFDLAAVGRTVRNLVTVGAGVTVVGGAAAAHWIAGFGWPLALLFGAIVSVTGPTVIHPLLERVHVSRRVDTILRGEGILIDPVGAILAVVVLEILVTTETSIVRGGLEFFVRMGIGTAVGLAGGWALGRILRIRRLFSPEMVNLVVLAAALMLFAAAESFAPESGLAAVVIAGMVIRQEAIPQKHLLRRFKGTLSVLLISLLFILLAAHLPLETIQAVGWRGVLTVLVLMWVVRPLNVMASTAGTDVTWREKAFLSWISPRGVVAISIASFVAIQVETGSPGFVRAGLTPEDGSALLALVFLSIAITVGVQGLTAGTVASLLGVEREASRYAIVVGANRVGRTVAKVLLERGWDVRVIDSNPWSARAARDEGLVTTVGNSLEEAVLEEAQAEDATLVVAATANQEINFLVAQLMRDEYHVPQVYPTLIDVESGPGEELVEELGARLAFGRPIRIARWNHELGTGEAEIATIEIGEVAPKGVLAEIDVPEGFLPVVAEREDRAEFCHAGFEWETGERIIGLLRLAAEHEVRGALEGNRSLSTPSG